MKKILLFSLIVSGIIFFACNKGTALPPYSTKTIFSVNSKMYHEKDTISSAGDTIWITAQGGNISDTTNTYKIAASLKATDTVSNLICAKYFSSVNPVFDTAGMSVSKLFHWTCILPLPTPAVVSKTKFITLGTFTYGLSLSSETGNTSATDSKTTYAE